MTAAAYQQLCARLAADATGFAAQMLADEEPEPADGTAEREHWISVFLDEHLPALAPDTIFAVTRNADAWAKASGHEDAHLTIRAIVAFEADVWDEINRMAAP